MKLGLHRQVEPHVAGRVTTVMLLSSRMVTSCPGREPEIRWLMSTIRLPATQMPCRFMIPPDAAASDAEQHNLFNAHSIAQIQGRMGANFPFINIKPAREGADEADFRRRALICGLGRNAG